MESKLKMWERIWLMALNKGCFDPDWVHELRGKTGRNFGIWILKWIALSWEDFKLIQEQLRFEDCLALWREVNYENWSRKSGPFTL